MVRGLHLSQSTFSAAPPRDRRVKGGAGAIMFLRVFAFGFCEAAYLAKYPVRQHKKVKGKEKKKKSYLRVPSINLSILRYFEPTIAQLFCRPGDRVSRNSHASHALSLSAPGRKGKTTEANKLLRKKQQRRKKNKKN